VWPARTSSGAPAGLDQVLNIRVDEEIEDLWVGTDLSFSAPSRLHGRCNQGSGYADAASRKARQLKASMIQSFQIQASMIQKDV
jgi:hypothetical protein